MCSVRKQTRLFRPEFCHGPPKRIRLRPQLPHFPLQASAHPVVQRHGGGALVVSVQHKGRGAGGRLGGMLGSRAIEVVLQRDGLGFGKRGESVGKFDFFMTDSFEELSSSYASKSSS